MNLEMRIWKTKNSNNSYFITFCASARNRQENCRPLQIALQGSSSTMPSSRNKKHFTCRGPLEIFFGHELNLCIHCICNKNELNYHYYKSNSFYWTLISYGLPHSFEKLRFILFMRFTNSASIRRKLLFSKLNRNAVSIWINTFSAVWSE